MLGDVVLLSVERHLLRCLGPDTGRAKVTYVGAPRIEVLRFGPDSGGLVTYVTRGMSAEPMVDPSETVPDPEGPRAELVLVVRGGRDDVLQPLTVLAAMPSVEGVVVGPGATFDLGEPLVPGSRCTGVVVDDPRTGLPDLDVGTGEGAPPVRFLPVVPATPEELAFKRVHGPDALWAQWHRDATDLADLGRPTVRLQAP